MYIGPDSSLVPHDGVEEDIDTVGGLDPIGTVKTLADRVNAIPDDFWDRHPKMQHCVEKYLQTVLDQAGENCAEYLTDWAANVVEEEARLQEVIDKKGRR